MAKYRVLETSFIGDKLVEKDAEIEYTGIPGSNLELVKGGASRAPAKTAPAGGAGDLA